MCLACLFFLAQSQAWPGDDDRHQQLNPALDWEYRPPVEKSTPTQTSGNLSLMSTRTHLVKILYLIPYDRTERSWAKAGLKSVVGLGRLFFYEQMSHYDSAR